MQLRDEQSHFGEYGAGIALVCQGETNVLDAFSAEMGLTFPCIPDPYRELYLAFGLPKAGWRHVFGKDARSKAKRVGQQGYQVRLADSLRRHSSWFQMPGTFIIDTGGICRYASIGGHPGDYPENEELFRVLEKIGVSG